MRQLGRLYRRQHLLKMDRLKHRKRGKPQGIAVSGKLGMLWRLITGAGCMVMDSCLEADLSRAELTVSRPGHISVDFPASSETPDPGWQLL